MKLKAVKFLRPVIPKTIAIFFLVQLAALLAGTQFQEQNVSVVDNPASTDNSLYFFATIVVFAVILLAILKFYKGKLLFLLLELAMEFTAVQLLVSLFASGITPALIAIATVILRLALPQTRQPLLMVTIAIVGGLLGSSLDIFPAALLALLLAGYDVIAVFYTKHMVTLAKELTNRQAAFSLKITQEKDKLELGTGDVVIPAMLIVSANRIGNTAVVISNNTFTWPALVGLAGAVIGITALLFYLEKKKGYWPALPPITVGTIAGIILATTLL